MKINRHGDSLKQGAKLSAFGKRVLIVGVILAFVLSIVIVHLVQAGREKAEKEQTVLSAMDRNIAVCNIVLSSINADHEHLQAFDESMHQFRRAKTLADKMEYIIEMNGIVMSQEGISQFNIDELNGSMNRIYVAMKELNE